NMNAVAGMLQQHVAAPVGPVAGADLQPEQAAAHGGDQQEQQPQPQHLVALVAPDGKVVILAQSGYDDNRQLGQPAKGIGARDPVGGAFTEEDAGRGSGRYQFSQFPGATNSAGPSGRCIQRWVAGNQLL